MVGVQSVLTYSFNLNPALRDQLSCEISSLYSEESDHITKGNTDVIQPVYCKTDRVPDRDTRQQGAGICRSSACC